MSFILRQKSEMTSDSVLTDIGERKTLGIDV